MSSDHAAPDRHGGGRASRQAAEQLGRSFKGAMAAVRRLRGRETRHPGELSDAQYGLLFGLREHSELSSSELALAADLSPATATEMLDALASGRTRPPRSAPSATGASS